MNDIKGQRKGTPDEKKKNMALDIVAAVYVTMESEKSKTMILQNFHEISDTTIANHKNIRQF